MPSRLAAPLAGRTPLLLLLASLLALGTACPGPTADPADAGKAGRDASKAGRDAEEEEAPDADEVLTPDGGTVVAPDGGTVVAPDGGTVVAPDGGTVVAPDGGTVVTPDGGVPPGKDAGSPGLDAGPPPNTLWLTLIHSSDTESAMLPSGTAPNTYGGVAYFTTVVKNLKAAAATWKPTALAGEVVTTGTLVVSAGDNFLAGLAFNTSQQKGVPFYETLAMQEIGYQVSALGNHDFDFGGAVTADFIRGFNPGIPFVSANIDVSAQAQLQAQVAANRLARSYVVDVGGEDVGVIGATPADLASLSNAAGITAGAIAAAVNAEANVLASSGINKIVLLSHNQAVANDQLLVPQLKNVDIVVSGGGHEVAASAVTVLATGDTKAVDYPVNVADADGNQVPIVVAGSLYKYVGQFVAKFDLATGKITAVDATLSTPWLVSGAVTADSAVSTNVVTPVQNATAALKTKVVATSAVPLDGRRNNVRTQETNEGDLMADAMLWQGQQLAAGAGVASPVVGLVNGGGIRNDSIIPAGTLSEYDTFSIAPFSNLTCILPAVSRAVLKDVLENSVSKVASADGRFLQVAGLKMTFDASYPARDMAASPAEPGQRVRSVVLDDGTVVVANGAVQAGAAIPVSTIDYEARGGDSAPYNGTPFTIVNATYQEALKNYLKTGLSGAVTAAQYPTGGTGRITAVNACGNGLIETYGTPAATEACDDKNAVAGDGCSASCKVEAGFTCKGAPSVCTTCGNGKIDALEACDGGDLGGKGCADVSSFFTGGTLGCTADCAFDTSQCTRPVGKLVINEVSTRGASAYDEYIELYNGSNAEIDLAGYVVRYRAAGTTTGLGTSMAITFGAGTKVGAGKHFLLGCTNAGGSYSGKASAADPGNVAADASISSNGLSDTGASLWLFSAAPTGTSLSTADAAFVDLVGYGTAVAENREGSAAAPATGTTGFTSVERTWGVDTNQNGADFTLKTTRTPQNLSSP